MKELHKTIKYSEKSLVPSEVRGNVLCNNITIPCTSLGINENEDIEEKIAKQLSEILFNKYLSWKKKQI